MKTLLTISYSMFCPAITRSTNDGQFIRFAADCRKTKIKINLCNNKTNSQSKIMVFNHVAMMIHDHIII